MLQRKEPFDSEESVLWGICHIPLFDCEIDFISLLPRLCPSDDIQARRVTCGPTASEPPGGDGGGAEGAPGWRRSAAGGHHQAGAARPAGAAGGGAAAAQGEAGGAGAALQTGRGRGESKTLKVRHLP